MTTFLELIRAKSSADIDAPILDHLESLYGVERIVVATDMAISNVNTTLEAEIVEISLEARIRCDS
jgi:hypothetical protein